MRRPDHCANRRKSCAKSPTTYSNSIKTKATTRWSMDCLVRREMNFDQAPLIVIWETTQACDLACVHCRASAASQRHRSELTTDEAYRLLDRIREFGTPLMVFTGGDPLKRPDLPLLLRRSVALGLRTNVSPSATPLLT